MIDTDKYEKHTPMWYLDGDSDGWWILSDFTTHNDCVVAEVRSENEADAQLMADAPDLLIEVKRLRRLCNTLFTYAHSIETGQSTIEKSNGEPLSTIDFEKDMTWVNWGEEE